VGGQVHSSVERSSTKTAQRKQSPIRGKFAQSGLYASQNLPFVAIVAASLTLTLLLRQRYESWG
jgi:hypothetical protein